MSFSPLRAWPLCVLTALFVPALARGGVPCNQPGPCDPTVAPPPVDEAALERAARADRQLAEAQRRNAWESVQENRRRAWIQRGLDAAPASVQLHSPLLELGLHGIARTYTGRRNGQLGGTLFARLQVLRTISFEVLGTMAMQRSQHDRFAVWTVEPSVAYVLSDYRSAAHGRLYAGPIFGSTIDGRGAKTLFGGKIGAGMSIRLTELGSGGYFGLELDVHTLVVGGVGAAYPALGKPALGIGAGAGIVVAL